MARIHSVIFILFLLQSVKCRSDGVSPFFCLSMFPVHDTAMQQSSQSPFFIDVGEPSFRPSQHINVTLASYDERPFIGVIMNAQLAGTDDIVGSFLVYPDNRTKTGSCSGNSKNYITHLDNKPTIKMEVTWIAPEEDIGPITFRATFMESFNVFWINVGTDVTPEQAPYVQTRDHEIAKRPIDLDFDRCGSDTGCMLYPGFCSGRECDTGVTFEMYPEHIHFNMWARTSESAYVSLGFSHDRLMGDDLTITCTHANGKSTFQYGINIMQLNYRQPKRGRLTDMATDYRDGSLYCSFTLPIIVNVTTVNESLATYDLHNPYHVMLAYGRLYEGTDVIAKHDELPIQSINKIAFDVIGIHRATALPLITQIHGALMLTAWIFFVGITTVVARYHKPMYPDKLVCGTKIWFQIHRSTAVAVFIFTAASFVIIFVKVKGLSDHVGIHTWTGITVMACVCLQLLGGLLRPSPDSRVRPVFNYLHWGLGKSAQILAAVTSVIIFNTGYLPRIQEEFGTSILCFWIGVQVFWEVLFEVNKFRTSKKADKPDPTRSRTGVQTVMLWCFMSTMVFMLIPAYMTIFFF